MSCSIRATLTPKYHIFFRVGDFNSPPIFNLGTRIKIPLYNTIHVNGSCRVRSSADGFKLFTRPHFGFGHLGLRSLCVSSGGAGGGSGGSGDGSSGDGGGSSGGGGGRESNWSFLSWYLSLLAKFPVMTKAVTSSFLNLVGDVICQKTLHTTPAFLFKDNIFSCLLVSLTMFLVLELMVPLSVDGGTETKRIGYGYHVTKYFGHYIFHHKNASYLQELEANFNLVSVFGRWLGRFQLTVLEEPWLGLLVATYLLLVGNISLINLVIDRVPSLDLRRTFLFAFLGLVLVGPTLHFWYLFLSKWITAPGASGAFSRLLLDQFLFSPIFIGTFLAALVILEGRPSLVIPKLQQEWFSSVLANWQLWIPFQFLNFRFVPQQFQVLAANFIALIWNVILSYKAHQEVAVK